MKQEQTFIVFVTCKSDGKSLAIVPSLIVALKNAYDSLIVIVSVEAHSRAVRAAARILLEGENRTWKNYPLLSSLDC